MQKVCTSTLFIVLHIQGPHQRLSQSYVCKNITARKHLLKQDMCNTTNKR